MKGRRGNLCVGTSGWTYADWRRRFYPDEVRKKDWLSWYATKFNSTEVNGSFYRTPTVEAVQSWRDKTPAGFRFAWKASKFITHWKRLSAASQNSLDLLDSRLTILGAKCGPVLFQLPARFRLDRERLSDFVKMLPRRYRYAFEFRDASWYSDPIFTLLSDHNISLCLSDHYAAPAPWLVTAHHVYVRGHGPTGRYKGSYPEKTLKTWSAHIQSWRDADKQVYVFFDNDQKSAAPKDAKRLREMCD